MYIYIWYAIKLTPPSDVIKQVIKSRFTIPFRPAFSGIRTDIREVFAVDVGRYLKLKHCSFAKLLSQLTLLI